MFHCQHEILFALSVAKERKMVAGRAVLVGIFVAVCQQPNCFLPHSLAFSSDGTRLFARGKNAALVWDLN